MNVTPKPSRRFSEYVRKIACDEWESGFDPIGNDKGILRHRATGQTVAYNLHDGGNDWNGPRNFAAAVQRICGCPLIEARGRKHSRKNFLAEDPREAAKREKYAAEHAERLEQRERDRIAALEAERRQQEAAARARASQEREREIQQLMRPGWSR